MRYANTADMRAAHRKQARVITPQDVVVTLGTLGSHGVKTVVKGSPPGPSQITVKVTPQRALSMAGAYIENHLAEELGSGAKFEVVSGGSEIYIDLPGGKQAATSEARSFVMDVNKALDLLKDAIDVAELRDPRATGYESGEALADGDSRVAHAVDLIREFSAKIAPVLRQIR